jgi:chloramphenicol-sensitive protein RarD
MNKGILAGLGAYTLWGLFPIYWKLLEEDPAIEILAHRWSVDGLVAILLTLQRDWNWLGKVLHNRRTVLIYPGGDLALGQLVHLHLGQ